MKFNYCMLVCIWAMPLLVSSMKTFEEVLGDPFEDCINPREGVSKEECQARENRQFRSIDGTCNNLEKPLWGASFTQVPRFIRAAYAREGGIPIGFPIFSVFEKVNRVRIPNRRKSIVQELLPFNARLRRTIRPSAQEVSDAIFQVANKDMDNPNRVAHIFMTFGQFIDHDLVIIESEPERCLNPTCRTLEDFVHPCNPIFFTSNGPGCNPSARSRADCSSRKIRQQVNQLTSYVDGSMIYGSTDDELRRVRGAEAKLLTEGDLLPFNIFNPRPCREFFGCFLAGDIRVNENIALASMHTVWVRLHNIIVEELKTVNSRWEEERLFQESRQLVIMILQKITFDDFLPFITDIPKYTGYNPRRSAGVRNGFATAAYRFGHSLIRNAFDQLNANFEPAREQVPLQTAFNNIQPILNNGIEETILGLLGNDSQQVDTIFSEGIAERLFIPPRERGFQNLVGINIHRGRDHGLPSYLEYRKFCKIGIPVRSFNDLTNIPSRSRNALRRLYRSINNHIDLFPAGVAENPVRGKLVGATFGCIIGEQFRRARDGDRFFFENKDIFDERKIREVKKVTLANVLCATLKGIVSIQKDVFKRFIPRQMRRDACRKNIKLLNFNVWKDNSK